VSNVVDGPTERYKATTLTLVYPPISHGTAEALATDADVQECMRASFCMIVGRAEPRRAPVAAAAQTRRSTMSRHSTMSTLWEPEA
jgi:hypothetical protein